MALDGGRFINLDEPMMARIRKEIGMEHAGERMSEIFKLLADQTRLRILQALEIEELCVSDIAGLVGLSQPSISHHLKSLRQSGLVKYRKSGKMVLYAIKDSRISALLAVARDYARK